MNRREFIEKTFKAGIAGSIAIPAILSTTPSSSRKEVINIIFAPVAECLPVLERYNTLKADRDQWQKTWDEIREQVALDHSLYGVSAVCIDDKGNAQICPPKEWTQAMIDVAKTPDTKWFSIS